MTLDRVAALQAERTALLAFLHSLSPEDWDTPSRAVGWTVKDVVSHLGAASHGFFTPWVIGLMASKDVEAHLLQNAGVACLSGTAFGHHGEGYLRLSYANSIDNIQAALDAMKASLPDLRPAA